MAFSFPSKYSSSLKILFEAKVGFPKKNYGKFFRSNKCYLFPSQQSSWAE